MTRYTTPKCPRCSKHMVERSSKHGKFYGCSNYPTCRGTMDAKDFTPEEIAEGGWKDKVCALLQVRTHPDTYAYWLEVKDKLPDCWDRPVSSTGKHHQRQDGSVPTIGEHTYEMLLAATKILRMFGDQTMTPEMGALLLAIAIHDLYKYGPTANREHTMSGHDKTIGDWVAEGQPIIPESVDKELLEHTVRYHSGRWSTDGRPFNECNPITALVHTLDMLSTASMLGER